MRKFTCLKYHVWKNCTNIIRFVFIVSTSDSLLEYMVGRLRMNKDLDSSLVLELMHRGSGA